MAREKREGGPKKGIQLCRGKKVLGFPKQSSRIGKKKKKRQTSHIVDLSVKKKGKEGTGSGGVYTYGGKEEYEKKIRKKVPRVRRAGRERNSLWMR